MKKTVYLLLQLVFFLAVAGCQTVTVRQESGFAGVCQKYNQAVGVLTYSVCRENGEPFEYENLFGRMDHVTTVATAFAIGPNQFATNGHVVYALRHLQKEVQQELLDILMSEYISRRMAEVMREKSKISDKKPKKGWKNEEQNQDEDEDEDEDEEEMTQERFMEEYASEVEAQMAKFKEEYKDVHVGTVNIRLAHSHGKVLTITGYQLDPDYDDDTELQADITENGERDLAILTTAEETEVYFPLATAEEAYEVFQGEDVGVLGFPMQDLPDDGGLNVKFPEATFKRGTIGKVMSADYSFSDEMQKNRTIYHDVPVVGGLSGSPMFNYDGRVIAVIWGCSTTCFVDEEDESSEGFSLTNPAQQNMAVRIDALEVIRDQPVQDIMQWIK